MSTVHDDLFTSDDGLSRKARAYSIVLACIRENGRRLRHNQQYHSCHKGGRLANDGVTWRPFTWRVSKKRNASDLTATAPCSISTGKGGGLVDKISLPN
jgi:hypothetical protein